MKYALFTEMALSRDLPEYGLRRGRRWIALLFRLLETIPRQKKSSLNSLIESDSILLTPEQSLSRGGNNLELLFTAPIRRRRNFSCG